jgi:hypothetical protein
MLLADFELGLLLYPEDGDNASLRNVSELIPNYTALKSGKIVPLFALTFDETLSNERVSASNGNENIPKIAQSI